MTDTSLSKKARLDILEAALVQVPFEGWTSKTIKMAVLNIFMPSGSEHLYFPGGVLEVIRFWSEQCDQRAEIEILSLELDAMRIRDKITEAVWLRLQTISPHENAFKRALARLALPDAMIETASSTQIWASADMIWRAIGDTSTDGNYYSKRTILSGVIASTMPVWLVDESEHKGKARTFLEARIENVMQFEKLKWDFKKKTAHLPNPAEVLGRLRYSAR